MAVVVEDGWMEDVGHPAGCDGEITDDSRGCLVASQHPTHITSPTVAQMLAVRTHSLGFLTFDEIRISLKRRVLSFDEGKCNNEMIDL